MRSCHIAMQLTVPGMLQSMLLVRLGVFYGHIHVPRVTSNAVALAWSARRDAEGYL